MKSKFLLILLSVMLVPFLLFAQDDAAKEKDLLSSSALSGLKFRSIGPALTSGRIIDFAVNKNNYHEYYVATAGGGVWKTTNSGTSWQPIFDHEGSYSIGCVTIDPNNENTIWVGTGENNSQRSVSYGDGVYRSDDGGKSWKNMGLKNSEHIGMITIDPRNSNIIFVAAQGPLWKSGGDRGLYKSVDGGKSWKKVLDISSVTGVNEVYLDPKNPDIMYASSYQRMRHVYTLIDGGPESAIYKSTDGGETWNKKSSGIPSVDKGRIGLAISQADNNVVYAIIEAADDKGGFFRSTDKGESWEKRSGYVAGSPQYYNEIFCDPKDVNRVYAMDTWLHVTDDGGKSFHNLGEQNKHVDNHAMWIEPNNTDHYLVGCDGGIYESFDRAETWNFKSNLPVTQFYRVAVDNDKPFYNVFGGTQDNFSLGGPSQNKSVSGIVNSDWFITQGGDGFVSKVDPEDPNIIYAESQYGGLVRYDKKSGEAMGIQPQPQQGEESLKWNWDSPLIISPHSHTSLYFAANKLFKSDDRGNTWQQISGDLTRKIDRNKLSIMGKVWSVDAVAKNASTSLFGNIVSLTESPVKAGLLYVGTDDGLINVTEDDGQNWRKIEKVSGVPETTYVSCLTASQFDANTVYAAFDNHKEGDFKPYLLKSEDAGKSWKSLKGNLPENGPVYSVVEDYKNPNLLFAGTEYGVYFTINGGKKWIQLKGGLPTVAIRDIAIQKRENDLVLATFGRGFYILDNYSPLRSINEDSLKVEAKVFPVKTAEMYIQTQPIGLRGKGFQGESYFTADNPPFGAVFTYYLKESIKTKKEKRQEAEKEALKKGENVKYPSYEELRAEDEEENPYLLFVVSDEKGNEVRKIKAPASSGIHRVSWDLRFPSTDPVNLSARTDNPFDQGDQGVLTVPGKYSVTMYKNVDGKLSKIYDPVYFNTQVLGSASLPAADRNQLLTFQQKVGDLSRAVSGSIRAMREMFNEVKYIKAALLQTPEAPITLMNDADSIEQQLTEIQIKLTGDRTLAVRNENVPPTISGRVQGIIYDEWMSTSAPTQTQKDAYEIAGDEFAPILDRLKHINNVGLKNLKDKMEQAGAPWTPGRLPDWNKN